MTQGFNISAIADAIQYAPEAVRMAAESALRDAYEKFAAARDEADRKAATKEGYQAMKEQLDEQRKRTAEALRILTEESKKRHESEIEAANWRLVRDMVGKIEQAGSRA